MSNFVIITLDTTAPSNPTIQIENGAVYAPTEIVNLNIGTSDEITAGYQMLIWGDVDNSHNPSIQNSEGQSSWISYSTLQQIKLSSTEGNKTIRLKIRDDVHNISAIATASIILDTTKPTVTTTKSDVSKISKMSGKNIATFSFHVDKVFVEYKVKVVSSEGAAHDSGVQVPTTGGSSNVSGIGSFNISEPINVQIYGADLESASPGDGNKIIKVFALDETGHWSA